MRVPDRVLVVWDTVVVLDGRLLNERTRVVLGGRESAGMEHGGVARRERECWYGTRWRF